MRRIATLAFLTATIALNSPAFSASAHAGCVESAIQNAARDARIETQLDALGVAGRRIEALPPEEKGKVAVWTGRFWRFAVKKVSGKIPSFRNPPHPAPARLSLKDIRFMQDGCNNRTQDGKYTVLENALNFRSGALKAEALPPIRVWMDHEGRVWSIDHRRLASMRLAGNIEDTPVVWASKFEVQRDGYKLDNAYDGRNIFVELGNNRALRVGDP